jgi:hypothetical protein
VSKTKAKESGCPPQMAGNLLGREGRVGAMRKNRCEKNYQSGFRFMAAANHHYATVRRAFHPILPGYSLTAIGAPAPNLYIAQEVTNNSFEIAGGAPGMKVSWQVTGIRQDAFAKANPLKVEMPSRTASAASISSQICLVSRKKRESSGRAIRR